MDGWKKAAIIGGIWGLISTITLSGGNWLNPFVRYTFGLPTTLAFLIADIWKSHIILFLLSFVIGVVIGVLIFNIFDAFRKK